MTAQRDDLEISMEQITESHVETNPVTVLPGRDNSPENSHSSIDSSQKKTVSMPTWQKIMRDIIGISMWVVVFLKLFVFDIDRWIVKEYLPTAAWILDYRFAFFVAILTLIVIFWRMHLWWRWIGYLLFYPFIVPFWRIPAFIIKRRSWTLGVALVALCVSTVRCFRLNCLISSGFILGTIICAFSSMPWLLGVGAAFLIVALVAMYLRTIMAAFRPTLDVFSENAFETIWGYIQKTYGTNQIEKLPVEQMTENQRSTWVTNLQLIIIYNRACYFLAARLRDIRRNNLNAVVYIMRLLALFSATAWTFFLLNYALYKAVPSSYATMKAATGFDFFYYSFNRLFSNSTGGIEPTSVFSQSLAMTGTVFTALIFAVVVVFVATSLQKSRDDSQMETMVETIQIHAKNVEPFIDECFGMTVQEAVEQLHKMRASFIGAIYFFSPSLRPSDDDSGQATKGK